MNCHLRTIERPEEGSYERDDYLALPTLTDDQVDIYLVVIHGEGASP